MVSFLICLALLIGGYFVYGKVVENTFGPDDRETPAVKINDGVDYVVLPQWKLFMIQLLNIAGLGPIFGAMQGALWGPIVFLWITFGTIFAGAVHDYFSGMMSERNNGASISEISGIYLGGFMKNVMRVFSVVLLIMVGTVFAVGPAGLIVTLFKNGGSTGVVTTTLFWLVIVLVYYFIATFISIDKIIGKIYPLFGICLIIMAVGVAVGIFVKPEYTIPEIWDHFGSMHPKGTPVWSFMFITVACGAGAIQLGFPVITNDTDDMWAVPKSLIINENTQDWIETSLEARDIKIKVTNIDIPVAFSNAFEGEIIRKNDTQIEIDGSRVDCCEFCRTEEAQNIEDHAIILDGPDFDGQQVDWDLAVKRNQMYHDFEVRKHEEVCNLFKQEVK